MDVELQGLAHRRYRARPAETLRAIRSSLIGNAAAADDVAAGTYGAPTDAVRVVHLEIQPQ